MVQEGLGGGAPSGAAAPSAEPRGPVRRRPIGLLAALLAVALTVVGAVTLEKIAFNLARQSARSVAARDLPMKRLHLIFQRAALADQHLLPIYGSSELYCCDGRYQGVRVFGNEPTGFRLFAVGRAGTADLFFAQAFGALGNDLRRRKIVISDSPPWFFSREGIGAKAYAGNFSPEIAETFVFDAPVSLGLKERAARRMLDYPATLADQPLLIAALRDLADGSPPSIAGYYLMVPAGRAESWSQRLVDARLTIEYIRDHPELNQVSPIQPRRLDWPSLLAEATALTQQSTADSLFGFPNRSFEDLMQRPEFRTALVLYCRGGTNREGKEYPYPQRWLAEMSSSKEWTDLELEVAVLRELGAQPLFWSLPLPGVYDDYTARQPEVRRVFYRRYAASTASVTMVSFSDPDEDRYFMNGPGAHFSPRGWVFAGRVLDLFWHDQLVTTIAGSLAELGAEVPAVGPPPPPWPGSSTYRWCTG